LAGVTLATGGKELTESFVRIVDAHADLTELLRAYLPATDRHTMHSSPDVNTGGFDLLLSGYRGSRGSCLEPGCPTR
jgi:hypothetical protein